MLSFSEFIFVLLGYLEDTDLSLIRFARLAERVLSLSLTSWPEIGSSCLHVVCTQELNKISLQFSSIFAITTMVFGVG